jgi:FtsP/CotA-like multicopper oxidase with cupredoxin domain
VWAERRCAPPVPIGTVCKVAVALRAARYICNMRSTRARSNPLTNSAAWSLCCLLALVACAGESRSPDAPDGSQADVALLDGFDRELALTPLVDLDPAPDVVEVELEARVGRVELAPGQFVEAYTYNGVSPGPLLRAREGDLVRVHFKNSLSEPTTIHWHGLEVPAAQDGSGHDLQIAPGARFDYAFRVPHAGTYWYHPHVNSAAQVWRGLYAPLIVDQRTRPELGEELTLVLHDLSHADGVVSPADAQGDLGRYFGHEGYTLLVNGRERPILHAHAGSTLHLRVINASISRYYRFAIDGQTLVRVAGDSGFVAVPEWVPDWVLAPGQRSEFVVTLRGAPHSELLVRALAHDRFVCGGGCGETRELMRIALDGQAGKPVALPRLPGLVPPIDVSTANERVLEFAELTRDGKTYLTLNGRVYGSDTLQFDAKVGDTELWRLRNPTQYDHPFHLHGFRFQLLSSSGKPESSREWMDTLNLKAESESTIAVYYDDRPGMWMFHCHILDHADLGMMGMLHLAR